MPWAAEWHKWLDLHSHGEGMHEQSGGGLNWPPTKDWFSNNNHAESVNAND